VPFDAQVSGGESAASWIGRVVATRPVAVPRRDGFDAFYEPPPAPAAPADDFDAFQRWLQELDR
jgi:hypothetical protein